jgi:hypothetical protein
MPDVTGRAGLRHGRPGRLTRGHCWAWPSSGLIGRRSVALAGRLRFSQSSQRPQSESVVIAAQGLTGRNPACDRRAGDGPAMARGKLVYRPFGRAHPHAPSQSMTIGNCLNWQPRKFFTPAPSLCSFRVAAVSRAHLWTHIQTSCEAIEFCDTGQRGGLHSARVRAALANTPNQALGGASVYGRLPRRRKRCPENSGRNCERVRQP